jgi:hypothetical protein
LAPPDPEHPGTNRLTELQMGTVFCVKTAVPQRGKALVGVCPSVVHSCATQILRESTNMMVEKIFIILVAN